MNKLPQIIQLFVCDGFAYIISSQWHFFQHTMQAITCLTRLETSKNSELKFSCLEKLHQVNIIQSPSHT